MQFNTTSIRLGVKEQFYFYRIIMITFVRPPTNYMTYYTTFSSQMELDHFRRRS